MQQIIEPKGSRVNERETQWLAVAAVTIGAFSLTVAEFLPASILTPVASSLGVTNGVAGQTVSTTAVVAMVTSLLISAATRHVDRRFLLLALSGLQILSNVMVAYAPGLPALLIGRMLLGVAVGGFWTISAAVAMRLVPAQLVPRALSIIFGSVSVATIVAVSAGSYLGEIIGWRNVFYVNAALALVGLVAQMVTLRSMPPDGQARLRTLVDVMLRPGMRSGMSAAMFVFAGHFTFFTYIRPFLEIATGGRIEAISGILFAFGIANFFGTLLAGSLAERRLQFTLVAMPLLMSLLGFGLMTLDGLGFAAVMVSLWGIAFGTVPVAWSTWLTRAAPDQTESAGGLLIAALQIAITIGAGMGGILYDGGGITAVFVASSLALMTASLIVAVGVRTDQAAQAL